MGWGNKRINIYILYLLYHIDTMSNRILINEPKIDFPRWEHWNTRGSTKQKDLLDPPQDFDLAGIYLFAHFKHKSQRTNNWNGKLHLNPNVIYIGQSKKVTMRLEGRRHEKIKTEYKKRFDDDELAHLYFSLSYTDWTSSAFREKDVGSARYACLLYLERKLIWEFAKTYSKVPILNKQ
jgi:hypothetical protein